MTMSCEKVQQLLSEMLDRQAVDEALVAQARAHCTTCRECAEFARGLTALRRAVPPTPDPTIVDRVIAAVRAEAPAAQAASPKVVKLSGRASERWWRTGAWAGAAAAVLIVAAFAAAGGARSILAPRGALDEARVKGSATASLDTLNGGAGPAGQEASATKGGPVTSEGYGFADAQKVSAGFIDVSGVAYRYSGVTEVSRSALTTAGTTTTSLDAGGAAQTYTVFATTTPGRVALISSAGTRVFELVTRRLEGRTYVLSTSPLGSFAEWPGLPSGFTRPTTADGAPTFITGELDDLGVQTYLMPGIPIESGFAVAPGTPPSDPARGNPGWTWWIKPK